VRHQIDTQTLYRDRCSKHGNVHDLEGDYWCRDHPRYCGSFQLDQWWVLTISVSARHTDRLELAHPKERARLGSLFNAFFFTGSALAAIITIGTFRMASDWAWRIPSLLQVAPALISFCFVFFIRKSSTVHAPQ
jgi:hypothetical protein